MDSFDHDEREKTLSVFCFLFSCCFPLFSCVFFFFRFSFSFFFLSFFLFFPLFFLDPPAFKPDVQIKPSEEVPVGSKFLNKSDGAQAVGGRLGARCVAGSIIADGQVTARSQGEWLDCNQGFILEESAGETEEPLGDNRGFIESREQKCVCVILYGEQSIQLFHNKRARVEPKDADGQRRS